MSTIIINYLFNLLIFDLFGKENNCSSNFVAGKTSSPLFFHVLVMFCWSTSRFLFYCSLTSHFCALSLLLIKLKDCSYICRFPLVFRILPGLTLPSLFLYRTLTPMQTSCWRRPSSWPKRESATQKRSTRLPTSSKTESKTLFAVWSSAKSCWTCLSPSTRMLKR